MVKNARLIKTINKYHYLCLKYAKDRDNSIDLTSLEELSFSAIMRELRQQCDDEVVEQFLIIYKKIFDALVLNGISHPAEKTMPVALLLFGKLHHLELKDA